MKMHMRNSALRLLAAVFLFVLPTFSQGILPNSIGGRAGERAARDIHDSDGFDAPSSDVRNEYGLVSLEAQRYNDASGTLQVILFKMKDPSGAYGLYSYLRSPDMQRAGVTDHSSISNDRALVLNGNLVLDVRGADLPKHAADLNALAAGVSSKASQGPLPSISEHLPTENFVDRSDKYILGPVALAEFFPLAQAGKDDWIGFYAGAEAEVAKYRLDGRELTLLLADYPTPQAAQKRLAEIRRDFHLNPDSPDQNASPLFARRSITTLAIVAGARNEAEAAKLLDRIQSDAEVTWNEPTFQFKEPTMGAMIVGAIEGSGVICVFALIAGIAFGGFRLITKRFFPDKVFDRSNTMQVLQLGLGSKPINAEDFYGIEGKPPK
jgi:hypothetical protein